MFNWYRYALGHYSNWANAFWIAPDGEIYGTDGQTHQGWVADNYELIREWHDIDLPEKIEEIITEESYEYVKDRLKELQETKQDLLEEGETEGFSWNNTIHELEELQSEDGIYMIEEGTRDNFNYKRWGSYVVDELLLNNWARVVYKSGIYHIEIGNLDNDKAINIVSDYLFSLSLDSEQFIRFGGMANGSEAEFYWKEFINSGSSMRDFLSDENRSWRRLHMR